LPTPRRCFHMTGNRSKSWRATVDEGRRAQSLDCAAARPIGKPVNLRESTRPMAPCASLIVPYALRSATAISDSESGKTHFTSTLASATIIDARRHYLAIPVYRRWNCPTPLRSFCASGRRRPTLPFSMAAIFPPTDRAPSAPVTCPDRLQVVA